MKPEDLEVEVKEVKDKVRYSVTYRLKGHRHRYITIMKNCADELDAYNKFMRHMEAIGITTGDNHGV